MGSGVFMVKVAVELLWVQGARALNRNLGFRWLEVVFDVSCLTG